VQDGSYWRKFQRNKLIRTKEKERSMIAQEWLRRYQQVNQPPAERKEAQAQR
jgi:hypothetical protein